MPFSPRAGSAKGVEAETSHLLPEKSKATPLQLSLNLVTCGLGTGVFTLPWSTAGASALPAIAIVAAVLALNAWTISILVEAADRYRTYDLGSLLGHLPGRLGSAAKVFTNVVLWFSMYLCLIGYIIVIVDCLQGSVPSLASQGRPLLVALSAVVVLPLCFLDQRRLSATSAVAVIANLNIFALVVWIFYDKELRRASPPTCWFGLSIGCVAMVTAMMQTVVIQMCVLPMYAEMQNRHRGKFNQVVAVSFGILFVLFSCFSVVGYLAFGSGVSSNVLLDLPDTWWGHVARFCAAASVVGVYPIILGPMIAPVRASLADHDSGVTAVAATCFIVAASMCAAFGLHDLGRLNVVNGAISLGTFVAVVPALVGLYLLGPQSQKPSWRASMYVLAVGGVLFSILGLILTDNYSSHLQKSCSVPAA